MSSFYHLTYCKKCESMTRHSYMDDTPKLNQYTVECTICEHRPVQGEDASSVMADMRTREEK